MYVLGIDGGGTKTTGVIANKQGQIFAEKTVGATNPNSVGKEQLKHEFTQLFYQLHETDPHIFSKVIRVFAGLSGTDHQATQTEMKEMIATLLPKHIAITVDNDAITALYSGTLGKPGIVQIAGTGAITYGVNASGKRQRVGGWGYLFSDHGSGYSIGRDALRDVFLAYDGLHEKTSLSEKILHYFNVEHVPDLIRLIYQQPGMREVIASLSRIVMKAADEGDETARQVIRDNGKQLGRSISHLLSQLFEQKDCLEIPIILVGGLFNRMDLLKEPIEEGLIDPKQRITFIKPSLSPVGGAVIAAWKEENAMVDQKFTERFCT